jgi:hypothetical protein
MQRNNSHETVPLTGEEQGLELQNGAITLVGPGTSVIQRNNFHNASLGEMTVHHFLMLSPFPPFFPGFLLSVLQSSILHVFFC